MGSNELKQLEFRPIPKVAYKYDPIGTLSIILPKVVMVQDVRKCYKYKIGAIGDLEIFQAYDKMCDNGILKVEFQVLEKRGVIKLCNEKCASHYE